MSNFQLLTAGMISALLWDGTDFAGQGGALDIISIDSFGIIVVAVLSMVVLIDSGLTWLAQLLRWLHFRELLACKGARHHDGPRMNSHARGLGEDEVQEAGMDCTSRPAPPRPATEVPNRAGCVP